MADDKYTQDIHIVKGDQDQGFSDETVDEASHLNSIAEHNEFESTYRQIMSELLDAGLVNESDFLHIASMLGEDNNVLPFNAKDRFERSKKNRERKNIKAKDLGHFAKNATDLTVGKESGKYAESRDHSKQVSAKEIAESRQKAPEKRPSNAPFKGPDAPTPPTTPTMKR